MKKKIVASVLSLAMCASLITGSTYALFTSDIETNIAITSGTVDVEATIEKSTAEDWIYSPASIAMDGSITDPTNVADVDNGIFANKGTASVNGADVVLTNVTPGDEVNLFVDIVNNSNVAIQYRYVVKVVGTVIEDIEVSIKNELYTKDYAETWLPAEPMAEIQDVPVSIALPTTATKQGGDFTVFITVEAVQGNADTTEDNAGEPVVAVGTAEELQEMLTTFGEGDGASTVVITKDIEIGDFQWVPVAIEGYTGTGVVTVEGNGHTIYGLNDTLFAGGFAGNSGIVVNNLTIAEANITSSNTQGSGAFINCVDSMPTITLSNCHLVDSTINGSRTGGLIGWTSGYSNVNDGAVKTYVTVDNCSVIGCTISNTFSDAGNTPNTESVGAIFGHAGANAWTFTTIKNCIIKNNKLNGGSGKTGVILGTANVGEVTISGCTMEGNKVNGSASDAVYGRLAFGTTGKLTVNGVAITA